VIAEHGIVSLLNVPVTFDSVAWGVLEADSERPGHFGEADAEFLETMAALLAGALQRRAAAERAEAVAAEAAARAERRAVLLRELQHRGKNNLALVAAMLARTRRAASAEQNVRAAEWVGNSCSGSPPSPLRRTDSPSWRAAEPGTGRTSTSRATCARCSAAST
jgi:transcriptional regulator with GAF, ATPase, and Fis domain